MAGIHGLKHVESLTGTNLAKDNPVRAHTQGVFYKLTLADFTLALNVWRARFHSRDMWLLELKLGGVLNRDKALFRADGNGKRVE